MSTAYFPNNAKCGRESFITGINILLSRSLKFLVTVVMMAAEDSSFCWHRASDRKHWKNHLKSNL